jgi:hypothetical protein
VGPMALTGLELLKQNREERTGVNRFTQGMEAPEINRTASGLMALQGAANKRIKFIARCFAEAFLAPLGRKVAGLHRRYPQSAKTIRLRGEWVTVDPSTWKTDYDATIAVGLGYSDKTESLVNMQTIVGLQEKIGTLFPGSVTYEQAHESFAEMMRLMGYKNPARFSVEPGQWKEPPPEASIDEKKLMVEHDLKLRELEVKELDIRLTYEANMAKIGIMAKAPQPDPVPPISM